jgi:hypothetical protein
MIGISKNPKKEGKMKKMKEINPVSAKRDRKFIHLADAMMISTLCGKEIKTAEDTNVWFTETQCPKCKKIYQKED